MLILLEITKMNKFFKFLPLCFVLALSFNSFAQNNELAIVKGSTVVLKIPMRFYGKVTKISVSGRNNYDIEITKNSEGLLLLNKQNYLIDDWIFMQAFSITNISTGKNKAEIALENANVKVELHFSGTAKENINDLIFVGSLEDFKKTDFYKQKLIGEVLPKIFPDKLSKVSVDKQLEILEAFNFNSRRFRGEEFKGKLYLTVSIEQDIVYNTIQLNQAERTARTIESIINNNIKRVSKAIDGSDIDGIQIETEVYFKDFIKDRYSNAGSEKLQIYFPLDAVKQWIEADITNQQLIDKSIVLVNGSRVQVSLTQFN